MRLFKQKRAQEESSVIMNGIDTFLGALVFLFFIWLIYTYGQYFVPPADTDMIAVNSIANTVEFALQKIPLAVSTGVFTPAGTINVDGRDVCVLGQGCPTDYNPALIFVIPLRLGSYSAIEFIPAGAEKNQYASICLIKKDKREDCRRILASRITNVVVDPVEQSANKNPVLKLVPNTVQNVQIKILRDRESIGKDTQYMLSITRLN